MHQCIVLGALRASPVRRLSGRGLWRQGQRVERVRDVGLESRGAKHAVVRVVTQEVLLRKPL